MGCMSQEDHWLLQGEGAEVWSGQGRSWSGEEGAGRKCRRGDCSHLSAEETEAHEVP